MTPEKRQQLEGQFPLVLAGEVEAIPGLNENPPRPSALIGFEDQWARMPLRTRRLAVVGPQTPGRQPARVAAMLVAAECRAQGIPLDKAVQLAQAMPFTADQTPRRKVAKQLPAAAKLGYYPMDGTPLLAGCCRDPRPRTGGSRQTARRTLSPFCDAACITSCPMLRAIRFPERCIAESDYAHMDASDIWINGGSLGAAGHSAWRQLVTLALATPDRIVAATASYVCIRSGGDYSLDHYKRVLRQLHKLGIAPITEHEGNSVRRHVRVLDSDELAALERCLGVNGKRNSHLRQAISRGNDYRQWRETLLTNEEKIEAWGGR